MNESLDTIIERFRMAGIPAVSYLNKEQIVKLLAIKDSIVQFFKALEDFALESALAGERYDGFKLVEGRALRKWINPDEAVATAVKAGYPEALFYKPREVLSVSDFEKVMGKKDFRNVMGGTYEKPQGKPTLVPESDKRPEMKLGAESDFAEILAKEEN